MADRTILTAARLREVLHYDPETGAFTRPNRVQGQKKKVGYINIGSVPGYKRVVIEIDGRPYKASRLAWLWMTGEWPKNEVDHDNRNSLDDRWLNLKDRTHGENLKNRCVTRVDGRPGLAGL